MTPLRQAVIFCGGLGNRLRPLTDNIPKPMAPVLGRPFLQFLIEQLADAGLQRVLLLTGYRGEQIAQHFRDGQWGGVQVQCVQTPVDWETGHRLVDAKSLLDERFLLLYSDNFSSFRLEPLWQQHRNSGLPLTVTVAPKSPGNVRLNDDGTALYDSTRKAFGLTHVEIGYMIVEKAPVLALDPGSGSFSLVLEKLSQSGQLGAFDSCCRYESISDLSRLRETEHYLRPRRLILLDRDGVINRKAPRGEYVSRKEEFHWIEENIHGLEELSRAGFEFLILSNQAGVGRGLFTLEAVADLHAWMIEKLRDRGIVINDIFVCPHHWDEKCRCRKPLPGLFFEAQRKHRFRLERTIYVGDDERDALAASRAGCPCLLLGEHAGESQGAAVDSTWNAANLVTAVPLILQRFETWEAELSCGKPVR